MVPPVLRRLPTSLLLALSLVIFGASVLLFTVPFDVDHVGPTDSTADCGPPIFEIAASDEAAPSTIAPPNTTQIPALERLAESTTTSSITYVFGIPVTTTTLPGATTTSTEPQTTVAPTTSTIPLQDVKASCGAPASKRFFLGGLGIVAAAVVGYLARLRRAAKFGYVVK
jgi:hypothetical protein